MSRRNKNNLIMTADAFSNPMFRLGFGTQAPLEATEYPLTRLTDNYAKLNSMYRTSGILQSIIDIIPQDMLREWFTVSGEQITPEDQDALDKAVLKTGLKSKIDEGLRWGRLYGGAVALIMIKGQENDLDKPLDKEAILPDSFAGLWILDRWSGVFPGAELVLDLSDPDFGLPKYYEIRASEAGQVVARVHHSRIIRFTGRELPYLERLAEMYWGESEVEPIYEDIALYDSVMANMGNLTFQANVETLAIKNLEQLFSIGSVEQQKRFWNLMQAQSVAKSNFGTRLIDQDTQLHTQQYSFTGFNYVVDAVQMNLSAKTHIPVTKLFGRSPSGMDATGDSDMQNYYDFIDGLRESKLRPVLERLLPILCMSTWGKVPDDMSIVFPPLWTPTAMELAQIASAKSSAIIAAFQGGLLNLGPAQNELKKLANETGMFDSIEDDLIEKNKDTTFQDTQQMNDPLAGLFGTGEENTDLDDKTRQNGPQSPISTSDGGPGSGNFGHAGRPGEVGGSAPGGTIGAHGKPRDYGKADFSDAIAEINGGESNSLSEWIDKDGNIKPERLAVHKQIIDDILKGKQVSEDPTMTMLGGGPASGKSSVMSADPKDPSLFVIDPDAIKAMLPGYAEMAKKTDKAAGFYHEESSAIAKQLSNVGYSEGINAVYDGTGDGSVKSVMRKIRDAREKGYKVNAKYVTIPTDEALRRNQQRYEDGIKAYAEGKTDTPPRKPKETVVRETHRNVSLIAPEVAKEFDSFELWANDRGKGNATLIATGGNGKDMTAVKGEEKAVQAFLDKGKE